MMSIEQDQMRQYHLYGDVDSYNLQRWHAQGHSAVFFERFCLFVAKLLTVYAIIMLRRIFANPLIPRLAEMYDAVWKIA